jgi:hypothetical protein
MSAVSFPAPDLPSPRPRRLTPPRWLDVRLVLGVVLVLGSVLIGAKVVAGARATYAAVAVRHDLAAGTLLSAADLRVAQVQLPGHGSGVYLPAVDDAVGRRLSRPVSAGELLPAGAVTSVSAQTTITVPLATGTAPDLHKGDRIELWLSTTSCSAQVLLPDVTVQAVHARGGSLSEGGGEGQDVVISVAPRLADRVMGALAIDESQVRAGVLVGSGSSAGGSGASGDLPDLAPCSTAAPRR